MAARHPAATRRGTGGSRRLVVPRPVFLLVVVLVPVVAYLWMTQMPALLGWDRPAEPRTSAAELRERPALADVLPPHVDAVRAVLAGVGETAGVTWAPADAEVFEREQEGAGDQLVDGYPVLRWTPGSWTSTEGLDLDEATIDSLAGAFREVLEPRGYTVTIGAPEYRPVRHDVTFTATDDDGSMIHLLDRYADGRLTVRASTTAHVHRDDACLPDPGACAPAVHDPLVDD